MEFIRFFLILIVPGIMAARLYSILSGCKFTAVNAISNTLVFDLIIFLINIFGLYLFKSIYSFVTLLAYFDCPHFTTLYTLLSIFIGLVLATISGLTKRFLFFWVRCD